MSELIYKRGEGWVYSDVYAEAAMSKDGVLYRLEYRVPNNGETAVQWVFENDVTTSDEAIRRTAQWITGEGSKLLNSYLYNDAWWDNQTDNFRKWVVFTPTT